jgi:hypothetical protein
MSLGRRLPGFSLPPPRRDAPPRDSFWTKVDAALAAEGFDRRIEEITGPFYANRRGRPSVPPGTYFRMLFIGLLEGIDSQRELAWRCSDSLSLRRFLGFGAHEATPDHSTLSLARRRLPPALHRQAMQVMLAAARRHDVLRGRRLPALDPLFPNWLTGVERGPNSGSDEGTPRPK